MAGTPTRRADDGARFQARLRPARAWLWLALPVVLLLAIAYLRVETQPLRPTWVSLTGAAANLTPDELKGAAADILERTTRNGGSGYTFEIVQRSSINARPGGPLVDIPDPNDRHKSLGKTASYDLATYIERGSAAPTGFWLEVRDGPTKDGAPDFEGATYELGTIVRDGITYRNEGKGWYETDRPAGIGLDPATASLLPTMLRAATGAKDGDVKPGDPEGSRPLIFASKAADIPGIVAVDAETFTELVGPLDATFDSDGRLIGLHVIARNTRLDGFDLLVDTTISFAYPSGPPEIPVPDPLFDPDSIPAEG